MEDFNSSEYDKLLAQKHNVQSMSHLNEMFEIMLLNREKCCEMAYGATMSKAQGEGRLGVAKCRHVYL